MLVIDRIRDVLMEDGQVRASFATYEGRPAIFMRDQAPDDTDPNWDQVKQYPRADLGITTQYMPERQKQGQMMVNLSAKTDEIDPLVRRIIDLLDGAILLSDEGRFSIQWSGTPDADVDNDLAHMMIAFDLLQVVMGEGTLWSPLEALYDWTERNIEDAAINPETWLPQTDLLPAIFWRTLSETTSQHWPAGTEYTGSFVAHVIHPDPAIRANMVRKLVTLLGATKGMRIAIPDKRPYLRLDENGIAYDSNRDPLRVGQVQLSSVRYVIPRPEPSAPRLKEIVYDITASSGP